MHLKYILAYLLFSVVYLKEYIVTDLQKIIDKFNLLSIVSDPKIEEYCLYNIYYKYLVYN